MNKSQLEQKIKQKCRTGDDIRKGGHTTIEDFTPDKEGSAAAYSQNNKIAYASSNLGMSYYQGISVSDGEKEIEIKPVLLWRNGENQAHDKEGNRHSIDCFEKKEDGSYRLVLINGKNQVDIINVDLKEQKSSIVETLGLVEYKERKENKTCLEKYDLLSKKAYLDLEERNPTGFNGMDVTFLNIVDNTKETELNLFSDRKKWEKQIEKIFSRPEDYLVVFEGTECLYGCPKHLGVYVGSPVSLETKKIFSEKAFRGFQKTWIKLNNTRLEIYDSYDGWNKSMFPVKRFNASELKQELESKD